LMSRRYSSRSSLDAIRGTGYREVDGVGGERNRDDGVEDYAAGRHLAGTWTHHGDARAIEVDDACRAARECGSDGEMARHKPGRRRIAKAAQDGDGGQQEPNDPACHGVLSVTGSTR